MKFLPLLFSLAFLASCSQAPKNSDPRLKDKDVPVDFDLGTMKNGVFTNEYFGFTFRFDEEWDVQTQDELKKLMELGSEMASGDDKVLKSSIKASEVRSAHHFGAYKHEVGTLVTYNPSAIVFSENIKGTDIAYGDEYLERARDMWPRTQMDIKQIGTIQEERIGNKDFFILEAEMTVYGLAIHQKYYCTIMKDFALGIIISYLDEEQEEEMHKVVESLSFK